MSLIAYLSLVGNGRVGNGLTPEAVIRLVLRAAARNRDVPGSVVGRASLFPPGGNAAGAVESLVEGL